MLEKGDLITLSDNNEYAVVENLNYDGKNYLYLIDINDKFNVMIVEYDADDVTEIVDADLITILMNKFNSLLNS